MNAVGAFLLTFCLAAAFVDCHSTFTSCSDDPNHFYLATPLGGKCYVYYQNAMRDYDDANDSCKKWLPGGILAAPKTSEINHLLASMIRKNDHRRTAWIGLNDKDDENEYVFEDGTALNHSGFSSWDWDEGPESRGAVQHQVEDCIGIDEDGMWHDLVCAEYLGMVGDEYTFFCEVPWKQ